MCVLSHFSCIRLYVTPWTVACQAPLSMGFSRQEYWNGLPCSLPGDLPNPGIGPSLLCLLHWRQPTPLCLPGISHGQRSLAGYGLWGHKELDTTEHICIHCVFTQLLHFLSSPEIKVPIGQGFLCVVLAVLA